MYIRKWAEPEAKKVKRRSRVKGYIRTTYMSDFTTYQAKEVKTVCKVHRLVKDHIAKSEIDIYICISIRRYITEEIC